MNNVILMGRLTRDPEVRYTTQGDGSTLGVGRYTLAVDRRGRKSGSDGEQTADFIRCVVFGARAEFAEKYLKQGTKLLISGSIRTGSYQNAEGQTVYTTDVIVNEQEFAESKGSGSGSTQQEARGTDIGDGFMNIPDGVEDEGLPFN